MIYRLGNMTLLKAKANRDMGNGTYADKSPVYETSDFEITKKVAEEYNEWTADKIASRQSWMAAQATTVWRVDF